jgi:hypothetical protein
MVGLDCEMSKISRWEQAFRDPACLQIFNYGESNLRRTSLEYGTPGIRESQSQP